MLHFDSDYMEGAHPAILERLAATNFDQTSGYGTDEVCAAARERIREACACPHANVYFLVGGTQANAAVADQILRPWEGIVSATTGHITAHEAGAVEACGRKTLPLPHVDGKLVAADVRALCEAYWGDENREHIVAPGAVYISHPTEYGTVYSLAELEALAQVCRDFDMRLFMDGARLGYGLAAVGADVTLADIARLCDAFYIGGTKVGAFCGEAVVFTKPGLDDHFFTLMKKRGALLAKGRFLGLQFDVLFGQRTASCATSASGATPSSWRSASPRASARRTTSWPSTRRRTSSSSSWTTRRRSAWPNMRRSASGSARPTAAPSSASPPAGPPVPKA